MTLNWSTDITITGYGPRAPTGVNFHASRSQDGMTEWMRTLVWLNVLGSGTGAVVDAAVIDAIEPLEPILGVLPGTFVP